MSYTPGTKLYYETNKGRSQATVLTNGYSMATLLDGVEWRERMPLEDWLILADKNEVQIVASDNASAWARAGTATASASATAFTPVEPPPVDRYEHYMPAWAEFNDSTTPIDPLVARRTPADSMAADVRIAAFQNGGWGKGSVYSEEDRESLPDADMAAAAAKPDADPEYAVGTMLRWKRDGEDGHITAIVTEQDILQVKTLTRGQPKVHFPTLAAWKATLPDGGTITPSPPTLSKMDSRIIMPFHQGTDYEIVKDLLSRWNIKVRGHILESYAEILAGEENWLKNNPKHPSVKYVKKHITILKHKMSCRTVAEVKAKRPFVNDRYGYKRSPVLLYFIKDNVKARVATCGDTMIVCDSGSADHYSGAAATTFRGLGVDMAANGLPVMWVLYRKKLLCLNA